MRADAQRSYDRIVEAAADVFVEQGVDASLNEIARRAGIGPGTLYRHFANREELLDVLMKDWVSTIQSRADQILSSDSDPRTLLIAWFEAFITHISVHRGGAARLLGAIGQPDSTLHAKVRGISQANQRVLDHLDDRGAFASKPDSVEVCRLVGGVAVVADQAELDEETVQPMLGVIADGLLRAAATTRG